jgi:hypothetical protein
VIKVAALYLLSSFFLANAGENLVVESNGCVMKVKDFAGFSSGKTSEGETIVKYKYKDGRVRGIKVGCEDMTLADAIAGDYAQEKDGLKVGNGSHPLSKANLYSGSNWSGVEGVYFLGSVCFTTSFEAGRNNVFFIETCGEEKETNELRRSFLSLLKHAETYYVEPGDK